jgi:hypothetical protein
MNRNILFALVIVLLSTLACGRVLPGAEVAPPAGAGSSSAEQDAPMPARDENPAEQDDQRSDGESKPTGSSDLEIVEGVMRTQDEGELTFFPGEIVNRSDVALGFIRVSFAFANDAGEVIYEGHAYADVPYVEPGKAAPYEYIMDSHDLPEGKTWSSYEISVTAQPHQTYSGVSITEMAVDQTGDYFEVSGIFSNVGSGTCEYPLMVVVGYNESDLVVMSHRVPPVDESMGVVSALEANEAVPFLAVIKGSDIANLRVIAVCEE